MDTTTFAIVCVVDITLKSLAKQHVREKEINMNMPTDRKTERGPTLDALPISDSISRKGVGEWHDLLSVICFLY